MKIIPLGTNGFFSSFGRQTACYVIPVRNILIILDAGTGLFRFAEKEGQKLLEGKKEIHIYLSHYHLDHTFGFYAAFKLLKKHRVKVFASAKRHVFWEFVKLKHFPVDYSREHKNFDFLDLKTGENKIDFYQVKVRRQFHRGEGSLAFRFDFLDIGEKDFCYVTDSEPSEGSMDFVRNTPLLLHEHEVPSNRELRKGSIKLKDHINDGHVTVIGAAKTAKETNVGKLALIHHNPFINENMLDSQLKIAQRIFPNTILAKDLQEIIF